MSVILWSFVRRLLQGGGVILAGVGVATIVVTLGEYSRDHWLPSFASVALTAFTLVTFLAVLVQFKRHWHHWTFWVATAGLLCLHVLAYAALLFEMPDWRLPYFAIVCVIETPVLCSILDRIGFRQFG
jgi:hypothetical protein